MPACLVASPSTYIGAMIPEPDSGSPRPFINRPEDGDPRPRVEKTYTGAGGSAPKHALRAVDLDIPVGSVFGLLGPNGAGKSTFINIMAGTVIKSAGSISVWGTDLDSDPRQARANIGIVPQELNIDAYFTPRQTLELQAGLFGVPKAERHSDALLETVGLSEQAHTYARRLSGGMRRRSWPRPWSTVRRSSSSTSRPPGSMWRFVSGCGTQARFAMPA